MRSSRSPKIELHPDESIDEFMDGRLRLIQSRTGYRFSIDAVLLSEFVTIKPGDRVVDLGTGCGIIPLVLLLTKPVKYVFGLEIQSDLVHQAVRNAQINGFENKMGIIRGDIKYPPLMSAWVLATINDILDTSRLLLKAGGRLVMVYPVIRLVDILVRMRGYDLEPKKIRIVYPGLQSEAKLALIEASLGGRGGLRVLPPLMDQGDFSIENLT
jgi:tRNA1Val (adenine37-N6)-methyltransferase